MYNALIIDDEEDARNVMRELLKLFCPEITAFTEAADGDQALAATRDRIFDFAFVDIQLNGESGIDLAKRIGDRCTNVIFVTAYDEYAVQAFQTAAIHYLLKPVQPELLQQAIKKADLTTPALNKLGDRIFLSTRERMVVMPHADISHVVGDGNYCTFHDRNGSNTLVSRNLSYYEKLIASKLFFRIHQSHLVNLREVKGVGSAGKSGGFAVLMKNGQRVPLARRRKDAFLQALKEV